MESLSACEFRLFFLSMYSSIVLKMTSCRLLSLESELMLVVVVGKAL